MYRLLQNAWKKGIFSTVKTNLASAYLGYQVEDITQNRDKITSELSRKDIHCPDTRTPWQGQ
jgi:hypothetical protein